MRERYSDAMFSEQFINSEANIARDVLNDQVSVGKEIYGKGQRAVCKTIESHKWDRIFEYLVVFICSHQQQLFDQFRITPVSNSYGHFKSCKLYKMRPVFYTLIDQFGIRYNDGNIRSGFNDG